MQEEVGGVIWKNGQLGCTSFLQHSSYNDYVLENAQLKSKSSCPNAFRKNEYSFIVIIPDFCRSLCSKSKKA